MMGGIAIPLPPPPPPPQQPPQPQNEVSPSTAHCFSCVTPSAVSSKDSSIITPKTVVSLDDLFGPISSSASERSSPQSSPPYTHQDKVDTGSMMNGVFALPSATSPSSNSMGYYSNSHHAPWVGGTSQTAWPSKATSNTISSNFALDDFFSNTTVPSSSSASSSPPAAAPVANMIYVDDSTEECGQDENGINLMDLHPSSVQTTTFQSPESYLDKFECRGGGTGGRIGNATNSLEHLTRNHDGNKVKARLLPLLSHYDVLGVPRDALPETIKRRYRLLAMSLHPDKTVGIPRTTEEEDLFKAITTAYEVLSEEVKRREYDEEILRKETL